MQNFTSLTITALWNITPCNFVDDVHYQQSKGALTKLSFCLVFFPAVMLRLASSGNKIDCGCSGGGYLYFRERERGGGWEVTG